MSSLGLLLLALAGEGDGIPPLPDGATLVLDDTWSSGTIDADRWYQLRKRWGQGNNGSPRGRLVVVLDD